MQSSLNKLQTIARILDQLFTIPGTRIKFGLDFLLGLLPAAGDSITFLASSYLVYKAALAGAPLHILLRMLFNISIDLFLGVVPFLGDAFDLVWKANVRNMRLLTNLQETELKPRRSKEALQRIKLSFLIFAIASLVIFFSLAYLLFALLDSLISG